MVRRKFKWKFGIIFSILLLNVFTKSLPIQRSVSNLPVIVSDTTFTGLVLPDYLAGSENVADGKNENGTNQEPEPEQNKENSTYVNGVMNPTNVTKNVDSSLLRSQVRPGQDVQDYSIEITIDGDNFRGRAMIDLRVNFDTREDALIFHAEEMNIESVRLGIFTDANAQDVDFDHDDGILEVFPGDRTSTTYVVIVEYTAPIRNDGIGIFSADFNGLRYLGMNLYPTHARRVFPCVDELTELAPVIFNFNDRLDFDMITANSVEEEEPGLFRPLTFPVHLWGMLAHNFQTVMIPVPNVILRGRTGLNQEALAITVIQFYFNTFNEWTQKNYFEIIVDQSSQMNIFALPDTSVDWSALSTVCIWEPYIYMEQTHSVAQRKTAFVKIAESMARQWFGFVTYPENWRHEWALTGLRTYAAYDVVREFETNPSGDDSTLLDMNTIFVMDVIQESLLRDGYEAAEPLLPAEDIFDDAEIRHYLNNHLMTYKAPSIIWMLRLALGENDYIKVASQALLNRRSLVPVTSVDVISAIEDDWLANEQNKLDGLDELEDFLEPWINARGYPLVTVNLLGNRVFLSQTHFGFTAASTTTYNIPITYTTSTNMNFDNIQPVLLLDQSAFSLMDLDEEEFILLNMQGQGYYRVEYSLPLMERIIECLDDPDCRNEIHPLNRATLLDDALNLARGGRLGYDIALELVLTMEHETEYAPWKAFIRNMNFIKRRLMAIVSEDDDDDLDPDIYLRMVRRTIGAVEDELTFYPDPLAIEPVMKSLTRGMVMDHACRAGYAPCIAAAIDWFYDPNSADPRVNPDIPKDIRPAVYCTMVREGDADVINALHERLEIEPSHWERIVILESLACSQDESFINSLLLETIDPGASYGMEERSKIFAAVASSSYENLNIALAFGRMRTIDIRNMYGGPRKLEEILYVLAENIPNGDARQNFFEWRNSLDNDLFDSEDVADRCIAIATENLIWDDRHLDFVYEWIDENDATKTVLSAVLLCATVLITLFNH